MTQAACHLILHYSTARLSWKTIKSLRRSQTLKQQYGNRHLSARTEQEITTANSSRRNKNNNNDASTQVEFEILQGWTLLALHNFFVSSGVEYILRFVIPFYYYFKMFLLIAFTVPSSVWSLDNLRNILDENTKDSNSRGLSPLIPFCFYNILVPGMQRVHEFMDHDPKKWLLYAVAMAPLLILDYFFIPGVLLSEQEKEAVRKARMTEKREAVPAIKSPPRRAFPPPIPDSTTKSTMLSSLSQPKFPIENVTPDNFHSNIQKGLSSTKTPLSPILNKSGVNLNSLEGFSPLAKSRITSSALRLRQFSRDHNVPSLSTLRSRPKGDNDQSQQSLTLPSIRRRNEELEDNFSSSSSPSPTKLADYMDMEVSDDDESEEEYRPRPTVKRRKSRERLSFGDQFREIVTGDASIRLRDHLFDLELPTIPSPSPRRLRSGRNGVGGRGSSNNTGSTTLSPNITTRRRSSRLAKRQYQKLTDELSKEEDDL